MVATPASFNNRAGLARAVNEHLADGTEVFVAEMGTYGPGEIADLCRWCPPDIAVITAIGPVHLERFGTEDRIVEAKSEIMGSADTVVLQVDDPRLAALADRAEASGKRVVRCSGSDRAADVCVVRTGDGQQMSAFVSGSALAEGDRDPGRGAARQSGRGHRRGPGAEGRSRGGRLTPGRRSLRWITGSRPSALPSGATILDDTYNSNPAGAAAALRALAAAASGPDPSAPGGSRRAVVVTPGMVELGPRQSEENRAFGAAIAATATDLLVVGRTNRQALLAGAGSVDGSTLRTTLVPGRRQAVDWVREHLSDGDVVLYENDLPDHYP